jgi:hypothetical protein
VEGDVLYHDEDEIQEKIFFTCCIIQGVSGGIVTILGGGSMDYSE